MKICLCFIGLQRTVDKTYENIRSNLINGENEYTKFYVTWKNENIDRFLSIYPDAVIYKVNEVTQEDEGFKKWKDGLQAHISWRRTYDPEVALFRYYQQIYLWKKAVEALMAHRNDFDILVRLRTDTIFINDSGPIYTYYDMLVESKNSVYFPTGPRQSILQEGEGCPDQFFIGKPESVLKALDIIDFLHKYKINYVEKDRKWFDTDTLEENIVQPESSLYYYLKGEGVNICYLPFTVDKVH
jgi:hypothetical protein